MLWKDRLVLLHTLLTFPVLATGLLTYRFPLTTAAIAIIFVIAVAVNVGWCLLWEAWYVQGKFFNVIRYPRALSLPTWLLAQTCRRCKFFDPWHPFAKPITLRDWNRFSTAITRRFDLAFLALGGLFWALIGITVLKWPG